MAVRDNDVAVAVNQTDSVAAPAYRNASDGGLDAADQFNSISVGVVAEDFNTLDNRHPFIPGSRAEGLGTCGALMRSADSDGRTRSIHDDRDRSVRGPNNGAFFLLKIEL